MRFVLNSTPLTVDELNQLPVKAVTGATVYIRTSPTRATGSSSRPAWFTRRKARRPALHLKSGNASTLDVVDNVKKALPQDSGLAASRL